MAKEYSTINNPPQRDPHADPYAFLGLERNPDGSIARRSDCVTLPPSSDPNSPNPVLTRDLTINESKNTFARIFLPKQVLDHPPTSTTTTTTTTTTKLPLMVDFHGGGFVTLSAASVFYNSYYTIVASETPAVIASIEYRRCPEHRLPAAYEDGLEALHVIKNISEEWLIKYADFSNCFLTGSSAGANLAYNLALRICSHVDDIQPLRIRGMILYQPWFGGTQRTQSELRLINDKIAPLCVTDILWEMCLPDGADRDHEYCNPITGMKSHLLDEIKQLGWKIMVKGCYGDPLCDRQVEFAKLLKENGVEVVESFEVGGYHGLEVVDPEKTKDFVNLIRETLICT